MLIIPHYVYLFKFKSSLSTLDGIYLVDGLLSYTEAVAQDIDIYKATYAPNGMSEESFKSELDSIRAGRVIKLTAVTNQDIILYIPEHLLSEIPDGSVQRYLHLGLAVDLGIFSDAEQLSTMRSEVEQTIATMTGVTSNSIVYTVEETWLTPGQYQAIEIARNTNISRLSNHYTDKVLLKKQVDSLKTIIQYYENALKEL